MYKIDSDGYLIYEDEKEWISLGEVPQHHVEPLSKIFNSHNELVKVCGDCSEIMDAVAGQITTGEFIPMDELLAVAKQLTEYAMKARVAVGM